MKQDNPSGGGEMWNERFSQQKHLYSTHPNVLFKQYLDGKKPGKILLPGDGEGRNGVYAAKADWEVVTFDSSEIGVKHSQELAREQKVNVNAFQSSIEDFSFDPGYFDVIAIIFLHLPRHLREKHFLRLSNFLKKNGEIYILGFEKGQINYNSGGPKDLDMLYSVDELSNEFQGLNIIKNAAFEYEIDEGPKHQGTARLIEFIAKVR